MKNRELKDLLENYPDDMDIMFRPGNYGTEKAIIPFTDDNVMLTSETAYVDDTADEDEWDCEDGKIRLGEGKRYLLINPIIV